MRATSASQSTEISRAFFSKPDLLFEKETCLLILFSILFNSTLPLPINLQPSLPQLPHCYQFQSDEEECERETPGRGKRQVLHSLLENANIFGGYLVYTILVYKYWGKTKKKSLSSDLQPGFPNLGGFVKYVVELPLVGDPVVWLVPALSSTRSHFLYQCSTLLSQKYLSFFFFLFEYGFN